MEKIVLALSGGMDSTALTGLALNSGYRVIPVSFTYGSKHNRYENYAAEQVAVYYGLKLHRINMESIFRGFTSNLLQSGGAIPEGHYESENMKKTVVPGRNLIFISVLAGFAASHGASTIGLGVHSGDHAIYPDCRPEFIAAVYGAVRTATDDAVRTIWTPFLNLDKTRIIKKAIEIRDSGDLSVPFDLTRTCYKDQPLSCGKCGSCNERLEAFANNGITDPIPYEI